MKPTLLFLLIALSLPTYTEDKTPAPTLKSILLEQLRTTHNQKDWFVDANTAVEGLTPSKPVGPTVKETTRSASSPII